MTEPTLDREYSAVFTANNQLYYQPNNSNLTLLVVSADILTNANGNIIGSFGNTSLSLQANANSNVRITVNTESNTIYFDSIAGSSTGGDPAPAFAQANSAFIQANTSNTIAIQSGSQANSAFTAANTADFRATGAFAQANSAFTSANTADGRATGAFAQANSAWTQANTANSTSGLGYLHAEHAYAYANSIAASGTPPSGSNTQIQFNDGGAFGAAANLTFNKTTGVLAVKGIDVLLHANNAYNQGNTANTIAVQSGAVGNSAFTAANTADSRATGAFAQANGAWTTALLVLVTFGPIPLSLKPMLLGLQPIII